jgi:GrpB-like predicted nucleotidyltransferase (UPF0157 family)
MKRGKRVIEVVDYDSGWPSAFRKESAILSGVLSEEIECVHHIGSTAIPGVRAKPVIDILLEVKDIDALDQYDAGMEGIGYVPKGEFGIPGRRFYLKGVYDRTHHIHAFNAGSPHVRRHIAFRDYLIAHPRVAAEYADLKARCAAECDNDNDRYCEGKREFVSRHEEKALEWMRCKEAARDETDL